MLNSNYIWIIGMCLITLVIMLVIMPGLIDYLHKIWTDGKRRGLGKS